MRTAADGAAALAGELAAGGGPLALALRPGIGVDRPEGRGDPPTGRDDEPGPAQVAAAGPRAAGHEREYELLLEMILEGSRLHYGGARLLADQDRDLSLLLGDQLYALGLARLAELGDLDAVSELADLISLLAQAEAAGDPPLAAAIWQAAAVAIGWGTTEAHELAKARARSADPDAAQALLAACARATM